MLEVRGKISKEVDLDESRWLPSMIRWTGANTGAEVLCELLQSFLRADF